MTSRSSLPRTGLTRGQPRWWLAGRPCSGALSSTSCHADEWSPPRADRRSRGARGARATTSSSSTATAFPGGSFVAGIRRAAATGLVPRRPSASSSARRSRRVSFRANCAIWRWSAATWMLRGRSRTCRPGLFVPLRDRRRPWRPDQPDFLPPVNAYGFLHRRCIASDLERVNGWDARFVGWGNEDIDLVVRLGRIGLRCGWPGPSATVLHLWHPDGRDPGRSGLPRERAASARDGSERAA